jgi:hypothetical protein
LLREIIEIFIQMVLTLCYPSGNIVLEREVAILKIKTFPLQFTEEYLNEIRCKAGGQNKTIKQFIMDLIQKEMECVECEKN